MGIIDKNLTTAELVVLSLLSEGENHGYGLNEAIEYRGFRKWTDIAFSSIYAILNRLEKKKLISGRTSSKRTGQGPPRKIFKFTKEGMETLLYVIKNFISIPEKPRSKIDLGVANIELLEKGEAIQCLEQHKEALEKRLVDMELKRKFQEPLPLGAEIIFDHGKIKGKAEIEWLEDVISKLKNRGN